MINGSLLKWREILFHLYIYIYYIETSNMVALDAGIQGKVRWWLWEINSRHYLSLINPSDQCLGLQFPWRGNQKLPWMRASEVKMLAVRFIIQRIYYKKYTHTVPVESTLEAVRATIWQDFFANLLHLGCFYFVLVFLRDWRALYAHDKGKSWGWKRRLGIFFFAWKNRIAT